MKKKRKRKANPPPISRFYSPFTNGRWYRKRRFSTSRLAFFQVLCTVGVSMFKMGCATQRTIKNVTKTVAPILAWRQGIFADLLPLSRLTMSRKVKFLHRPYIPLESNLWLRKHHTNSVLQGIYRQRNNILVSFSERQPHCHVSSPLTFIQGIHTLGPVGGKTWRHGYEGKDMYNFIEKRININKKKHSWCDKEQGAGHPDF